MRSPFAVLAACAVLAAAGASCNMLLGTEDPAYRPADSGAATDGAAATDSGTGDSGPPVAYGNLTDRSRWTAFNLANVDSNAKVFSGASFDGRYIYLVPTTFRYVNTQVARYDTMSGKGFDDKGSWAILDLSHAPDPLGTRGETFIGSVFDGKGVYLIPSYLRDDGGVMARYATNDPFEDAGSWSGFDLAANLGAGFKSFAGGGMVDGYLYFAPYKMTGAARYDTRKPFTAPAAWTTYDLSNLPGSRSIGYFGVATDGRYVYYVPHKSNDDGLASGRVVRFDTSETRFDRGWQTYDVGAAMEGKPGGFLGAIFDGQYLYFVPNLYSLLGGLITRFDTRRAFDDPSSWKTFSPMSVPGAGNVGYAGGQFDGRYVYFVPQIFNQSDGNGASSGTILRYDTLAPFAEPGSYQAFDITYIHPDAKGFRGSAFDGRYIYLVPVYGSVVARFDARTPAAPPSSASLF